MMVEVGRTRVLSTASRQGEREREGENSLSKEQLKQQKRGEVPLRNYSLIERTDFTVGESKEVLFLKKIKNKKKTYSYIEVSFRNIGKFNNNF